MELENYIVEKKDNFNASFYIIDFGFKKQKTWNKLIKDFGFNVCKNKRFLENDLYYIHNNIYLSYLVITKKDI